MSSRVALLTATTASAASYAVRSAQLDNRYPPPSCSAFHGRSGSSECAVTTCGTPYRSLAQWPAMFAYQVWEWTSSALSTAAVMVRSVDSTRRAELASGMRASSSECAIAPARGSPMQCTSTASFLRNSRTRKSTCTPAPPYTSGGNSRVRIAIFIPRP
jgi:hypothetical protein